MKETAEDDDSTFGWLVPRFTMAGLGEGWAGDWALGVLASGASVLSAARLERRRKMLMKIELAALLEALRRNSTAAVAAASSS